MSDILNMTNEELRNQLSDNLKAAYEINPEYQQCIKEYRDNIKNDFETEWSKRHFKWFFKKRRQRKLRSRIMRRYTSPIYGLFEEILEDMWPKLFSTNFCDKFVDIKEIKYETPDWDTSNEPKFGLCVSERILREAIVNTREDD